MLVVLLCKPFVSPFYRCMCAIWFEQFIYLAEARQPCAVQVMKKSFPFCFGFHFRSILFKRNGAKQKLFHDLYSIGMYIVVVFL